MQENSINGIKQKKKRKIIIIKKSLQVRFALIAFFAVFLATALVGIDIYITINRNMLESFSLDPEFKTALILTNNLIIAKLLLYTIIVFLVSFFISHKFAGPVYRFEQSCEEVGDGNLTCRVNLRKTDELMDLQDKFNLMVDSLQSKVQQIEQLSAKIEESGGNNRIKELRSEINKQFKIS